VYTVSVAASPQVAPGHILAETLQQGIVSSYDAASAHDILPEELYPTSDSLVAEVTHPEDLALLQQRTTEQKLAAVQQLVQWLLDNHAEVCFVLSPVCVSIQLLQTAADMHAMNRRAHATCAWAAAGMRCTLR
jgi:hypothetical protein